MVDLLKLGVLALLGFSNRKECLTMRKITIGNTGKIEFEISVKDCRQTTNKP